MEKKEMNSDDAKLEKLKKKLSDLEKKMKRPSTETEGKVHNKKAKVEKEDKKAEFVLYERYNVNKLKELYEMGHTRVEWGQNITKLYLKVLKQKQFAYPIPYFKNEDTEKMNPKMKPRCITFLIYNWQG